MELIRTTEAQTAKRDADALANPQAFVAKPVTTNEPRPPSKRRALNAQAGKHDRRRTSGYSSDSSSPSPSERRAGSARQQRKSTSGPTALHNSTGSLAKLAAKPNNPYARLLHSAAATSQGEGGPSLLGKATSSQGQRGDQGEGAGWESEEDALQESDEEQGSQRLHSAQGLHGLHDRRVQLGEGTSGQVPSFLAAHRQRLQQSTAARPATTLPRSRAPGAAHRQSAVGGLRVHKRSHGVTKQQSASHLRRGGRDGSDEDYEMSGDGGWQEDGADGAASDSSGDWGGPLLSRARKHGWTRAGLRGVQQQVRVSPLGRKFPSFTC